MGVESAKGQVARLPSDQYLAEKEAGEAQPYEHELFPGGILLDKDRDRVHSDTVGYANLVVIEGGPASIMRKRLASFFGFESLPPARGYVHGCGSSESKPLQNFGGSGYPFVSACNNRVVLAVPKGLRAQACDTFVHKIPLRRRDELMGFVSVSASQFRIDPSHLVVDWIYVREDLRGRGLAMAMANQLLDSVPQGMFVQAATKNPIAQRILDKGVPRTAREIEWFVAEGRRVSS